MLGLLCYAALGMAQVNGAQSPYSLSIWGSICGLLFIVGLLAQRVIPRFRSLLVREKEDRYDIIKFAFTFGLHAQAHLQRFKDKRAASRYTQGASSQGLHGSEGI